MAMPQDNSINPSPELVQQWIGMYFNCVVTGEPSTLERRIAKEAAKWGYRKAMEDARRLEARHTLRGGDSDG